MLVGGEEGSLCTGSASLGYFLKEKTGAHFTEGGKQAMHLEDWHHMGELLIDTAKHGQNEGSVGMGSLRSRDYLPWI